MTHAKVTVGIPTRNRAAFLREAIASVLGQNCGEFCVLVSDNASTDATSEVIASFADTRITHVRSERDIGMIANFDRLLDLVETEFIVLLPDDDLLYPDYLASVLPVFDGRPTVGLAHTAFDLVDEGLTVLERARNLVGAPEGLTIESRLQFLRRSMAANWILGFSTAIYRTEAILGAGGLRESEEPFSDAPMWMRIALDWDVAFVNQPLAAIRIHGDAATADLGSFVDGSYKLPDHRILHDRRLQFLEDARSRIAPAELNDHRALAAKTFRSQEIQRLADDAGLGAPWTLTTTDLAKLVREDPRALGSPRAWRLVAAQLGGRRVRSTLGRLRAGGAGRS
jgi:glycosyltransferase involved in cell wall biosynthesis